MARLNLIPIHRQRARQRRALVRRCVGAVGAYAVVLAVAGGLAHARWHEPLEPTRRRVVSTKAELDTVHAALAAQRPELAERQRVLAAQRAVAVRPDWGVLLRLTARALGDDVVLRACQLRAVEGGAASYEYTLRAVARSPAAAAAFVLRLEELGAFASVTLVDSRGESLAGREAVGLRVRCVLAAGEDAR